MGDDVIWRWLVDDFFVIFVVIYDYCYFVVDCVCDGGRDVIFVECFLDVVANFFEVV